MIRLDGYWNRLIGSWVPMHRPSLVPLTAALILAGGSAARADVTPSLDQRSLGTVINQDCGATSCVLGVTEGTSSGSNLFHRFENFDTRTNGTNLPISGVTFQNQSTVGNVIVGVLSPSHISVPISLLNPASLFWLSPAGITVSGNGSFSNVTNLTLSTATGLRLSSDVSGGTQVFDAVQTTSEEASQLSGIPDTGPGGLLSNTSSLSQLNPALNTNGDIVLQGGLLTVDQSLLLDAQGGNVQLQNTTLSGQGSVTIPGNSFWSSGTITGLQSLDIPSGATLTLDGGVKQLGDTTINNGGTIAWTSGDILQIGNSVINNNGLFDIRADVTIGANIPGFTLQPGSNYSTELNNFSDAFLRKSAGANTAYLGGDSTVLSTIGSVNINNQGTIDVQSGILVAASGTFSQAGTLNVGSGATFGRAQGVTNLETGILSGTGSIDSGSVQPLVNLGRIRPGEAGMTGTLSIQGNVIFGTSSQLEMDIGGSDSIGGSVASDQLRISGSASLGGSLIARPADVVFPVSVADLITATSMTGGFDPGTSSILPGFNGAIVNGGTIYRLSQSGSSCEGICWDGGGGANTNWATIANWTGDLLPTAGDLVYLDLVNGAEVTLTDSRTVAALFSSANNNLSILNGGSLVLSSTTISSQLDGGLSIAAGGSLRSSANVTINGAYSQSGGSLTGDGSVAITPTNGPIQISNASLSGRSLTLRGLADVLQPNGVSISNSQLTAGVDGLSITSSGGAMQLGGTIESAASALLKSEQGIQLTSGTQIRASGSDTPLVVEAGAGPFINDAGSSAFNVSGGGRWLIYLNSTEGSRGGGLPISFKQYGKTLDDRVPILGTGNGLLLGISPTINISLSNISKVYDGTASAAIAAENLQSSGALDGDVVVVSATGSYTTAGNSPLINPGPEDVGTGKVVIAEANLVSASSSPAQGAVPVYGYQLSTSTISSSSGSISPLQLSLTGLEALNKTYDGTTTALFSGTPTLTPLSGDSVSLAGTPTGSFTDRNVGNAKPVSLTGLSLSGPDAGNYSLLLSSGLTADITPLALSAGFSAADKVYDGSTTALISGRTLSGAISGDAVSLSGGNASFLDRNVGNTKSVTASGFSLTGADAANYSISNSSAQAVASITPLALTASFSAADKVYDGSSAALISGRTLSGAISGDAVSLSGGNASFLDRNVGNAKSVNASGFSLTGADAANYSLSNSSAQAVAAITVRPLATWQSSSGGSWSDAANWDALPDGNNVAAVLIPTGSGAVVFDAAVGPTNLQSLTNQGSLSLDAPGLTAGQLFNSGSLTLATALNLSGLSGQSTFAQTGGNLGGGGSLNILAGSGSWSGGSWSGGGQVVLSPGASLTIEGASSQWAGRNLVVQGASDTQPAATLTVGGTTTAIASSNAIVNRGLTSLNGATLSRNGGSLQLQNTGVLINNGSSNVNAEMVNSSGTVQVNSGSLRLNGDGSDSNGSVQVANGAELIWGAGERSLLGGTSFSGSGSFRLAGATLTATGASPLVFDGPLLVDSGTLRGSGSLAINSGYRQSGGQLSGFSNVAINQPQGVLQISGVSRDSASIVTAPGGTIRLTAPAGSIELNNTGLDARGTTVGGSILFEAASSILTNNAVLLTSGSTTGGTITIGNANTPPILTTIRNSDLIADPPATGGVINIYGQTIVIEGSTLNLFGDSGGSLIAGTTQTSQLSIDSDTQIIAGPGASISCSPDQSCDRARIERRGTAPTPEPAPAPTTRPVDKALGIPVAVVVLDESISQPPLSNDAQTSSQVQQPPTPLLTATGGGSAERNPLDVSLDQAASFSPDLFAQPTNRSNSLSSVSASSASVQTSLEVDPASAAMPPLVERPVSSLSTGETRENFNNGTAQAQQDTARRLGLSEAEQGTPPSIEDLQKAMQEITQWIRTRQQGNQNSNRNCGGEGQPKCPS